MKDDKPRLLIIENDPIALPLYHRELSPHYLIVTCETEAQLWQTLAETRIDLIILEPANGNDWIWSFLNKFRADEQGKEIPIIFCTVLDERKRGLEQGVSAYLIKPVYANVLHYYVQKALENYV